MHARERAWARTPFGPSARRRRFIRGSLLSFAAAALTTHLGASAARSANAWPPSDYRFDEVTLSVRLDPAHGLARQELSLSGEGGGWLEDKGSRLPFQSDRVTALKWINSLYHARFFDMPALLPPRGSVFLKADGGVGTQTTKMHDTTTTTVCFKLPRFEKCVSYQTGAPAELESFVGDFMADARSLVARAAASK